MSLFRVDKHEDAERGLLGYDWLEVLTIEPWALAFPSKEYGDWCDRRISNYYVCLTPDGLVRITSDDFWTAMEEYREYDERTQLPRVSAPDSSVVQDSETLHCEHGPS